LAGEVEILNEYPEKSLIIRTAWLYSPYGKNFYKTMLTKALNSDESVQVVSDQQGQPTSALDLAELTVKAVINDLFSGIFHGTNAGSCSWFEFAKYIFEIAGADPSRVTPVLSAEFATLVQRPKYSVLDNQKWSEFGIVPLGPWKDSVQKALPDMMLSLAK
jgi:dTDP-4-dehydrorhamnose reductase